LRVCLDARGLAYLDREDLNIYDAVISYFIAQAHVFSNRGPQSRRYLAESVTIIRSLDLPQVDLELVQQQAFDAEGKPQYQTDFISPELARRVFWKIFVDLKTMQQLGESCPEIAFAFPSTSKNDTPLPLERDDAHIFTNSFEAQAYGSLSELTGFLDIVKVYQSTLPLIDIDPSLFEVKQEPSRRRAVIKDCLALCKSVPTLPETPTNPYRQMQDLLLKPNGPDQIAMDPIEQRNEQVAMQKAILDASSIATRFYLLELFWQVGGDSDVSQEDVEEMRAERRKICKELLQLVAGAASIQAEFLMDKFVRVPCPTL
jgi:hypothetical protein